MHCQASFVHEIRFLGHCGAVGKLEIGRPAGKLYAACVRMNRSSSSCPCICTMFSATFEHTAPRSIIGYTRPRGRRRGCRKIFSSRPLSEDHRLCRRALSGRFCVLESSDQVSSVNSTFYWTLAPVRLEVFKEMSDRLDGMSLSKIRVDYA